MNLTFLENFRGLVFFNVDQLKSDTKKEEAKYAQYERYNLCCEIAICLLQVWVMHLLVESKIDW